MHDILPKPTTKEHISPEEAEKLVSQLMEDNEDISPIVYDRLSNPVVAQGLVEACRRDGEINTELLAAYLTHSNRFDEASHNCAEGVFGEQVTIEQHHLNVHENGRLRREESGPRIKVENLPSLGVDPRYVLMFRVTQPSSKPKPELYWTSNPIETISGLQVELGSQASSSIVLIDSLASIAENGGLIRDINDDGGVAVRQIGLGDYDQDGVLASFARPEFGL